MTILLIGIGFLFVVEGLVLALAPNIYNQLIELVAAMSDDMRRTIGLTLAALGVALLWLGA